MNETNGHAPVGPSEFQVDPGAVIEALGQQVARLTVELAIRDAAVAAVRAELDGLKAELTTKATTAGATS